MPYLHGLTDLFAVLTIAVIPEMLGSNVEANNWHEQGKEPWHTTDVFEGLCR